GVAEVEEVVEGRQHPDGHDGQQRQHQSEVAAGRAGEQRTTRRSRQVTGDDGQGLAHAGTPFMTRSSTPCSSISEAGTEVRTRPSPTTSTVSARPSTSSISLETMTMAWPSAASPRM